MSKVFRSTPNQSQFLLHHRAFVCYRAFANLSLCALLTLLTTPSRLQFIDHHILLYCSTTKLLVLLPSYTSGCPTKASCAHYAYQPHVHNVYPLFSQSRSPLQNIFPAIRASQAAPLASIQPTIHHHIPCPKKKERSRC